MNENRNPSLEENDFLLLAHDELNSPTIFIRSSLSDEKSTRKFDNNSNRSELALTPSITPTPSNCLCLNESSRESTSFSINVISNSNSDTTDDESYYPAILPPRSLLPSHKFPEWNQNSNSNLFSKPETSTADVKKDYSSKILRLYDPSYEGISSSLQMVPNDRLRRLIHPTQSSLDFALHINFAVSHNQIAELTEPVFANLALYSINNNSNSANLSTSTPTATRVSECLHIDLSPDHIKARFAYVYENADDLKDGPISDRAVPIKSEKSRTATGRDAITMTINEHCFVTLPTNINKNDLYIVIQLTKVLTPENEKTGSRLRSTREERLVTDPDEAYRRLHKYRQIIGLGVMKVYPGADGIVAGEGDVLRCLISPFKASINSTVIAQYVKDNLSDNNTMPLKGDSVMGLDVLITLSEQRPTPPSLDSASDTSDRCSGSGRSVTELAFFPPVNSGLYRRLQATLDNDLFIYPLALENFEHRNLCLKIQLVEITTAVGSDITMVASDIKVLKHVYTSVFGSNNSFNSVALSSTSYHNKSPTFAEEVRVMLPDVIISDRHFLQFTVEHIHVKAKPAGGGKGVFGGVFGSAEPVSSDVCTTIGVGLLPLLQKEGHFLPDFEYEIPILSAETSVSSSVTRTYRSDTVEALRGFVGSSTVSAVPILRVSTRCMSALQSMCPWVQALMQQCVPRPLGRLLGSRIDPVRTTQHTTELLQLPAPNINLLTNAVKGLRVASTQQIITHFRVIIRILNRVLCGGNGIYSEGFSDPFAHSTLRCHAFLDLLHLFGCIVPELSDTNTVNTNTHSVSNSNISKDEESDTLTETNLLQAFTEFFFTEELPINLHESYTSTTVSRPDANTCMSSLSFINPSSVAVDGNNRFKYLSYVSDHFASEMEKVLIEEEIDRAVNQLVEECILNASASAPTVSLKSVSPTRESRKYLNTASMKSNSTLSLVRSKQTMASLNNKYKAVSKPAKMNSRPNSVSNELSLPPFQYKDNRVTTAEQLTHHQSTSSDPLVSPTDLQTLRVRIRPPRPCYSSLEGYPARKSTLQNDGHTKWWPWMYEVLAHQFLCLLLSSAGEVSMSIPGHTPVTAESVVYPINSQAIPKSDVPSKDIKHLAIDHVSTLLSMIHKSLLLRITYEKKSAPIVLDTQSLFVFEQLLAALAKETRHRSTSLTRDRLLTCAVSEFLRSLFAVFIPAHVALLIASFYSNLSAAYRKEDCIELRLLLCEKLSTIDHFIYVNNSASLDQISSLNVSVDSDPLHEPSICSSRFRSLCINSDTAIDPPVNWLSNLFMHVSFNAYRHDDRTMHMQEKALQLMRSLLVQQSCDLRYQNPIVVQQVACLYLPLLVEVLKETYHLASKQYDSVERKERLPLLLHLLENVPSHVLRSEIRLFCLEQYRFIPSESMQSGMRDGVNSRPMSMTLQPVVSPRFACVTSDTSLASKLPADLKGTPQSDIVGVDVNKAQPMIILLLVLLNSVIDTFEYQSYTPLVVCSKRDDGTNAKLRNLSTAGATNKGTGFDFSTRLNRLESLLNKRDRKSSGSASNRSAVSTTTAADIGEDTDLKSSITKELTNTSSPMPEQRKWFKHKEALGTKLSGLAGRSNEIDHELYKSSLTLLSHTSSAIIARTVALILDECQFSQIQPSVNASDRSLIMPLSLDTPRTMTLKVVRYSLFTALHGLYCHQTVGSVISFLHIPRQVLRVYGVEIFLSAVGDTLQDWVRVLFRCFSYSQIEVTNTACELIVLLLSSCYRLYGSTTRIADVLKAVLFDSIEAIIDVYHNTTESIAEEDKLLDPILQAILTLQQNSKSILESVIASNSDTSISSQRQCNSSLVTSQETEMIMATARELETLFHAITQLRHHLMTPVAYLWEGGSGLDIALKRGSQRRSRLRKSSVASLLSTTTTSSPLVADMDAVAESFLAASNVFDPIRLPRLRIFWLEQLVRLHESLRTRGDLAEARWRIYEVMLKVENHWESTWALRKPLSWRKGSKSVEEVSPENSPDRRKVAPPRTPSPGSSPTKRLSTASPASPVIAAPTTSDRTLAMASLQNPRNFLGLLFQTVNMPSAKPWADKAQFYTHMEQTLTACKVHLCNIGLSYLAERSTFALVDLNRKTIQVRKIAEEYATLAASFQATSDSGNSNFGMGTFYWVQFIGQGIPVQLRHEFIYRNSMNLHVSEVHSEFKRLIEASVSPGIEVKVASQLLPSTADIDSEHAIIFITSVKPVYLPATPTNRYALNQTKEFQLSVPFTKTGTKSHAKSMNEQWKRTITFSVSEPFPYICGRQKVCLQTSRELSPIEAAIDDIEDRISDFKQELSGALVQNNIMRLVQGSVMPQVNAGAGEVAKVFLRKYDSTSEISMEHANGSGVDDSAYNVSSQAQLQLVLKETLLEFLLWSRTLLKKCREAMRLDMTVTDGNSDGVTSATSTATATTASISVTGSLTATVSSSGLVSVVRQMSQQSQVVPALSQSDIQNSVWLAEMERGFDTLVDTIYPYINDIKGAIVLKK